MSVIDAALKVNVSQTNVGLLTMCLVMSIKAKFPQL